MRLDLSEPEFMQLYRESTEGSVLRQVLDRKLDAIIDRENYNKAFKDKSATDKDKEKARRAYLESKGIPYH